METDQTGWPPQKRAPGWKRPFWYPPINSLLQISIFQIHQIFNISYFPQFNLSFEKIYLFPKIPKNHPKIYTKPPNSGLWNEHRDLALFETWARYWQEGRKQPSHVPGLKKFLGKVFRKSGNCWIAESELFNQNPGRKSNGREILGKKFPKLILRRLFYCRKWKLEIQPRPQGLLLDDFQNGGSKRASRKLCKPPTQSSWVCSDLATRCMLGNHSSCCGHSSS